VTFVKVLKQWGLGLSDNFRYLCLGIGKEVLELKIATKTANNYRFLKFCKKELTIQRF
jgi:hypothetical protein